MAIDHRLFQQTPIWLVRAFNADGTEIAGTPTILATFASDKAAESFAEQAAQVRVYQGELVIFAEFNA